MSQDSHDRVVNHLMDLLDEKDRVVRSLIGAQATIWDRGHDAHRIEMEKQAADPDCPIHRPNPHRSR